MLYRPLIISGVILYLLATYVPQVSALEIRVLSSGKVQFYQDQVLGDSDENEKDDDDEDEKSESEQNEQEDEKEDEDDDDDKQEDRKEERKVETKPLFERASNQNEQLRLKMRLDQEKREAVIEMKKQNKKDKSSKAEEYRNSMMKLQVEQNAQYRKELLEKMRQHQAELKELKAKKEKTSGKNQEELRLRIHKLEQEINASQKSLNTSNYPPVEIKNRTQQGSPQMIEVNQVPVKDINAEVLVEPDTQQIFLQRGTPSNSPPTDTPAAATQLKVTPDQALEKIKEANLTPPNADPEQFEIVRDGDEYKYQWVVPKPTTVREVTPSRFRIWNWFREDSSTTNTQAPTVIIQVDPETGEITSNSQTASPPAEVTPRRRGWLWGLLD